MRGLLAAAAAAMGEAGLDLERVDNRTVSVGSDPAGARERGVLTIVGRRKGTFQEARDALLRPPAY